MIRPALPDRQRLDQLLADRALFGLSPMEAVELNALLVDDRFFDPDGYDRTAAVIDVALGPTHFQPLPSGIAAKVRQHAATCVSKRFDVAATLDG